MRAPAFLLMLAMLFAFRGVLGAPGGTTSAAKERKCVNPVKALLWGIIPGGGQWYCGNYAAAAGQFTTWFMAGAAAASLAGRDDFIDEKDLIVKPTADNIIVAEIARSRGLVYTDANVLNLLDGAPENLYLAREIEKRGLINSRLPIVGESILERDMRLLNAGRIYEFNPLLKYGGRNFEYMQLNRSTFLAQTVGGPVRSMIHYSMYSGYRDAGGIARSDTTEDHYGELAIAPFQPRYILDWRVWAVVGLAAALINNTSSATPLGDRRIIAAPGTFTGETMAIYTANTVSAAVGEEAFYRGFVNYALVRRWGAPAGIFASSSLFAAEHLIWGFKNITLQFVAGLALGLLHYDSDFDLRPPVAAHFWLNIAGAFYAAKQVRVDPVAGRSNQEVMFMPALYTRSF